MRRSAIGQCHPPDAGNIGVNVDEAAGQVILHLHVHVIPAIPRRRPGPAGRHTPRHARGGGLTQTGPGSRHGSVRCPPPFDARGPPVSILRPPHWRALVQGGDDPLLPHLLAHLTPATRVDVAVAFVLERGVAALDQHLTDVLRRGGGFRVLTGDYLDVTEPNPLRRLLDLAALAGQTSATVDPRVFETAVDSFHPKAYIVHQSDGEGAAFVGENCRAAPGTARAA
jgi:hypothetical protein